MKNKILGWIAVVWGGAVVVGGIVNLAAGQTSGGAYGAGQIVGFLFGGVLLFVGIRTLRKLPKSNNK